MLLLVRTVRNKNATNRQGTEVEFKLPYLQMERILMASKCIALTSFDQMEQNFSLALRDIMKKPQSSRHDQFVAVLSVVKTF